MLGKGDGMHQNRAKCQFLCWASNPETIVALMSHLKAPSFSQRDSSHTQPLVWEHNCEN